MKLKYTFTTSLIATLTILTIPPEIATAQGCFVDWQINTPTVRCQPPENNNPGRRIVLNNSCPHPIKSAVRIQDLSDTWITLGWFSVRGNNNSVLATDSQDITTRNSSFYFYAETTDGSKIRWSGGYFSSFGDRNLHMAERFFDLDPNGDFIYTIRCDE